MAAIYTANHLQKNYGGHVALRDVSFSIEPGRLVGLLGPNGAGKSTLMNIIGCLDTATSGTYHLHGRDVSALSESELARVRSKEIGFIFQSFQLLQRQDALQNVELPLIYAGMSGHERAARAQQMLERVGLKDKMHHFPNQLSGGQQQRLCIARALAVQPEVLLMDEPTSALDPISTSKIEELAMELKKDYTIVMVTHNMQQATRISDKTAFFLLGEVVEFDDTDKLFSMPSDKRTEDYITGRFG